MCTCYKHIVKVNHYVIKANSGFDKNLSQYSSRLIDITVVLKF